MTGLEKGKALFEKKEFEKAIEVLTIFLTEQINNADALYTRAICYRKTEQFEKSIADLTVILIRLPNEPTLLCERGISYFKNNDVDNALKDMDLAIEMDANNPFRYSSRAYIRTKTDINGAMQDYEKAIELDPKDEISLNNLGLLQENAGRINAAKKNFKKSNKIIGYTPEKRTTKNHEIVTVTKIKEPKSVINVMLSVFKSKKVRQEYYVFVKSLFKKSNT